MNKLDRRSLTWENLGAIVVGLLAARSMWRTTIGCISTIFLILIFICLLAALSVN